MEDLFELAVVLLIFVFGAVKKSKKKQQKKAADKPKSKAKPVWQAALAQTAPVQPAEPVVLPLEALASPTAPRQNFDTAFSALSELLENDETLPAPDKSAVKKVRALTSIEAETAIKQHAEIVRARAQESISGHSAVDEHGCIGGSMPDHSAEGEKLAEHAAHERERREHLAAEAAPRTERLRPTAAELRKAVVMSEILDKPVSLRRRRI